MTARERRSPKAVADHDEDPVVSAEPEEAPTPEAEPDRAADMAPAAESAVVELPCPAHFPDGWPDGVTSAGCVDGQWDRALPEPEAGTG